MRRQRRGEPEYQRVEHTRIRRAIGERTQSSFRDIPQFSSLVLVDAQTLVEVREARKSASVEQPVPTYNDYFIKSVAVILNDHPRLNAWCDDEGLRILKPINLGFACATDQGVLLPTVFDADQKSLAEIAQETAELIDLARRQRLRASLQQGAGFTVSNLGPSVVDWFQAIISPPQTAILAIGSIAQRPLVADGSVVARPSVYLNLTTDHRAADAADAAAFLAELTALLNDRTWLAGQ